MNQLSMQSLKLQSLQLQLRPLQKQWQHWSERFIALQVREQWLLTIVAAVIALALCDSLLWSPQSKRSVMLTNQLNELTQEQQTVHSLHENITAQLAIDPDQVLREQNDAAHTHLAAQNQQLHALTADLIEPSAMPIVLRDLLEKRKALKLIELANSAAVPFFVQTNTVEIKANIATIYRHGLQFTVQGNYFDVLEYLQSIEALPWHFFWEALEYRVDHYPTAEVKIKVYTLSGQEGWIGA